MAASHARRGVGSLGAIPETWAEGERVRRRRRGRPAGGANGRSPAAAPRARIGSSPSGVWVPVTAAAGAPPAAGAGPRAVGVCAGGAGIAGAPRATGAVGANGTPGSRGAGPAAGRRW